MLRSSPPAFPSATTGRCRMSCSTTKPAAVVVSAPGLVTTGSGVIKAETCVTLGGLLSATARSTSRSVRMPTRSSPSITGSETSLGCASARRRPPATSAGTCSTPLTASVPSLACFCSPPTHPGWVSPRASMVSRFGAECGLAWSPRVGSVSRPANRPAVGGPFGPWCAGPRERRSPACT